MADLSKYSGRQRSIPDDAITVQVLSSPLKANMYLYLHLEAEIEDIVPEALLARFGEPQPVAQIDLWPDRPLARVKAADVLRALTETGFFLQLPPPDITHGT